MLIIKGFAQHINFTDNTVETINPIGEISNHSLTYAKDVGHYSFQDSRDITLHTFSTKLNGEHQRLTPEQINSLFTIINWMYDRTLRRTVLYSDEIGNELITQFATTHENIQVGEMINHDGYYCPEYIFFSLKGVESSIRIFFSDDSFRRRFDEYTVLGVPALGNVDDFLKDLEEVRKIIENETTEAFSDRIELIREKRPDTVTRLMTFEWHDRTDPTVRIKTNWAAIVYGIAGDNVDAQKDAIAEYILSHSNVGREVWRDIFPDIFKRTEFTFVPQWDKFAIPNRSIVEGIYSPIVPHHELTKKNQPFFAEYPQKHIDRYSATFTHNYKSVGVVVCSSPENRDDNFSITDIYPDYITVNSLSQDWNRMNDHTREWAEEIANLIIHAEDTTEFTDVPYGYYRLKRHGKVFIGKAINNVQYLVATKSNFDENQ